MLQLPDSTKINIEIPTDKIISNLNLSDEQQMQFTTQIEKVVLLNKISAKTINTSEGSEVIEIEVFHISVATDSFDYKLLKFIDKAIPYHNIYIVENDAQYHLAVNYSKDDLHIQYISEWNTEKSLNLYGLNLESVYNGIVRQIAGDKIFVQSGNLKCDIEESLRISKIQKEIARLEKLARAEKQPKKKFEYVQKIKELERLL